MKKLIAFALIIVTLALALASCAGENTPEATTYNYYTSKITPAATTATTAATTAPIATETEETTATTYATEPTETTAKEPEVPVTAFAPVGYMRFTADQETLETRSKILIFHNGEVAYYYSKADGEFYPFCFDPFCDHVNFDREKKVYTTKCIGRMITDKYGSYGNLDHVAYVNSRIYFIFYDEIYSCSEIATDLRVEVSFSKKRSYYDWFADPSRGSSYRAEASPIQQFQSDGSMIFFRRVDENGKVQFYMYDTVSRKLSSISDKMEAANERLGVTLYVSAFADGKVFVKAYKDIQRVNSEQGSTPQVIGTLVGTYVTDYDFSEFTEVSDSMHYLYEFKTEKGHYVGREKDGKYQLVLLTYGGEERVIVDDKEKALGHKYATLRYMSADGRYFYFTLDDLDRTEIGRRKDERTKKEYVYNNGTGGKLYRYDTETGKKELIFDDLSYDIFNIYLFDTKSGEALFYGNRYVFDENGKAVYDEYGYPESHNCYIKCKLDESGNIVSYAEIMPEIE